MRRRRRNASGSGSGATPTRARGRVAFVPVAATFLGLLLIGLALWTANSSYHEQRDEDRENLDRIAESERHSLIGYFERAEALTALLARNPAFAEAHASRSPAALREASSALAGIGDLTRGVGEACLTDDSGRVEACAVGNRVTPRSRLWPDYSWTDWFDPALEHEPGEVHQSEVYFSQANYFVLANATPVPLPKGAGEAIVHVETPIESFRRDAAMEWPGYEIAVVDIDDEMLVFHTASGDISPTEGSARGRYLPDPMPPPGELFELNGRSAVIQPVDARGGNVNDWAVVAISQHPDPGFAASIGATQIALLAAGLLLVLAGFVVRRFRRQATEETDRIKGDLLGLVSHELRTPLTSIIGYTELLAEVEAESLSSQGRGFLEVIERNAQRELRLVGDLLTLQQIDGGRFAIKPAVAELAPIVEAAIASCLPKAKAKDLELRAELAHVEAPVDAERVGQVLDNLLSNALKYTPEGGEVDVRLFGEGQAAVIEVADTGLGIPKADLERLFERMFRASNATELHIPGVGLGLSITKAIVEAHGGRVLVRSEEGEGTTFRVELPGLLAGEPGAPAVDEERLPTRV